MREIKYRGLNEETGEWVYGWYTKLVEGIRRFDAIIADVDGELTRFYIHNKETIGQYTGLHDKNGKEIYEGDIVKFEDVSGYKDGCASVIWHEDSCGYYLENDDDNIYDTLYDFTPSYQMEVIGNIHENPELLEGRE